MTDSLPLVAILVGMVLGAASVANPNGEVIKKVREFDANHALQFAKQICKLGPRYDGNKAELKAADMFASALQKYGLKVTKEKVPLGGGKYTYNVIAEIPGTKEPNRYVIVGSHIDSPGFCEGATDDAAALGIQVEMARVLAKNFRPEKTVLIIGFGGEELWFKGSKYFVEHHPDVVKNCDAMIDLNCVGAGEDVFLTRHSSLPSPVNGDPHLIQVLKSCAEKLGFPVTVGDTTYPSDTWPFYHNKIRRCPVCQVMNQPFKVAPWSEANTADKLSAKDMEKTGETVTLAVVELTNAKIASKPLWEVQASQQGAKGGQGYFSPVWFPVALSGLLLALLARRRLF
ncbi:MAG: M28 family peptidase [Methanopyri archaeon]|nr:M28 family peptidase [Methanopyri archaeon]